MSTTAQASALLHAAPETTPRAAAHPVALHPANPRYFLFRGRQLALISATEHYGAVINRPFDFMRYLDDAADKRMTMTRTFLLFRELQSAQNPSSPCKPESPDFIAPWPRSGPGRALDGEPQFDLEQWNPEYFARLHRFLRAAGERGIVVELTLFSNSYGDHIWALNPLRRENNRQGVGITGWQEFTSLNDQPRLERQLALARKIVRETAQYDHVVYEICNEPGGGIPGHVSPAEIDAWQAEIARVVREELARLGGAHLVVGCQAFAYTPQYSAAQDHDASYAAPWLDAVNVHPLPDVTLAGRTYQMGRFMSKDLALREFRAFCLAAAALPKPCVHDEDNVASCYRDEVGWAIHRKRAWTALLSGAHYDYIDFSVTVGSEAGTAASQRGIRSQMRFLSEVVHGVDLVRARPIEGLIGGLPAALLASTLALDDGWLCYLADARELSDPGAGETLAISATLTLPRGDYVVAAGSPTTGMWSPALPLSGDGGPAVVLLPHFRHDLVLRISRAG